MAVKGKEIAGKASSASSSKSKKDDSDKSGRKRKRSGVLQFFDDVADVDDDGDESEEDDFLRDYMDEDDGGVKGKSDFGKGKGVFGKGLPFLPKEEELSDDEIEKLLQERYKPGSKHVKYADDDYEAKTFCDGDPSMLAADDGPPIFKVKCTMGRERHSAFCLMQKYVDLQPLGTKLQVVSAFAPEHIKGYIYIEADRECDVVEACKGLCSIYSSRMSRVPKNELSHMVSLQRKQTELSKGTWVRVKYGNYKGDLAQVVAVDDERKRATVKLVPRIDMQALAKKLNGGVNVKQTAVPTPKLISSSELEDFRPHIELKRDRLTGLVCEALDGLMLKDGYLFKKIHIESLICSGVVPSAKELIKFEKSKKDESDDLEWLSGLFGEKRKKRSVECSGQKTKASSAVGKGGKMKGFESTSGTKDSEGFDLHDIVFFGRKDFGVIIGVETSSFKILKEDPEGAKVVTVESKEIKNGCSDKKFTGLDQHMKAISVDDTVRVLEGPFTGRQGIVKQIYKGTIFVYDDENQLENDGYFCAKSQLCENLKQFKDSQDKTGDISGPSGFEDSTTSPKSPQSPKKPWQANREFNSNRREEREGAFSIGQTLRIRIGPLKGHLCRVIAIYRSDVTVKLDSQLKVITVKGEHLSEAGVKRYSESSYTKPLSDILGGAGAPAENDGWSSGVLSSARNPWSDSTTLPESTSANPFGSTVANDGSEKGKDEDNAWDTKSVPKKDGDGWGQTPWGKTSNEAVDLKEDQVGNWAKSTDSWAKATAITGSGSGKDEEENTWGAKPIAKKDGDGWGQTPWSKTSNEDTAVDLKQDQVGNWGSTDSWAKATAITGSGSGKDEEGNTWSAKPFAKKDGDSWGKSLVGNASQEDKASDLNQNQVGNWGKGTDSWGEATANTGGSKANTLMDSWNTEPKQNPPNFSDKGKGVATTEEGGWGKAVESQGKSNVGISNQEDSWGKASESWKVDNSASESKAAGWNTSAGNPTGGGWGNASSGWGKGNFANKDDDAGGKNQTGSWNSQKGDGEDGGHQQDSWDGQNSFDGGRGSGGRRGRGGGRRGGRDNFGRGGRSFGRGQSYGGDKDDGEKPLNGGGSFGSRSGGGTESWNNNKDAAGDQRPSWGNSTQDAGGVSTNQGDDWNKSKGFGGDGGSTWNKGSGDTWSNAKPFGGAGEEGGFSGNQSKGWKSETSNWNSSSPSAGKQSSGWSKGGSFGDGQGGGGSGSQGGWATNKTSSEKQNENAGQSSGWESKTTQKASGGNKSWGGNQGGWGKKASDGEGQASGGWKSGGGEGTSGWKNDNNAFGGGSSSWNKNKDSNEDPSDNWKGILGAPDKSGGNWGGGKSSGGDWSSGWNGGAAENEAGDASNRGRGGGFGRGGRWSGSDRGGGRFGSGSDRGGRFGNRGGGSDRGGFGNRGRGRRDESGGGSWNGGDNVVGDGWKGGDKGDGGWGSTTDNKGSWNGGDGGDKGGGGWGSTTDNKGSWNRVGGSDRGGFGNRGRGSDRGGFGNRGRGRRDQSGGGSWNGGDNGGGDSWKGGDNGGSGWGNTTTDNKGSWNQGGGGGDKGGSWNGGDNGGGDSWKGGDNGGSGWGNTKTDNKGSWNQGGGGGDKGGQWKGGWNKGTADAADGSSGGGKQAGDWNGGGWNKGGAGSSKEAEGGGGWNKGVAGGSSKEAAGGGWNSQGSSWSSGGARAEGGGWNKGGAGSSKEAEGGGGWNKGGAGSSKEPEGGGGGGWNKGGAGSSKEAEGGGGWNKGVVGGSSKEAGGGGWNSQGSSWNSGGAKEAGDWNKGCATKEAGDWNSQNSTWNAPRNAEVAGGSSKEAGSGWNNSQGSDGGTKSAPGGMKKEEAGGSGGDQADPWGGKPAGDSSWGKGSGGW